MADMGHFCNILAAILVFIAAAVADTPANCTYEDIRGLWRFQVAKGGGDNSIDCSKMGPVIKETVLQLDFEDTAIDEFGNKGFWTLIYNQGFEVVVHGRKYFAFSKYKGSEENATSYCDQTLAGWSHDSLGHDWACYVGQKLDAIKPKHSRVPPKKNGDQKYVQNAELINQINNGQKLWRAGYYPQYEGMTLGQMQARAGGSKAGHLHREVAAVPVKEETRRLATALPDQFDWRNVAGINYVSPVRNQAQCGSCYAFASMGMTEARLRIISNNTIQKVFSTQDIVDCSNYSQGCDGGFPYLIAGKYAEDYGLVEESCNPYRGDDSPTCKTDMTCPRQYATKYSYVGGFYGGCNEEEMLIALVRDGPLSVAFEVYSDFAAYTGGIYHHTFAVDKFNPFELTNHAVLLVGYGVDAATGVKYWSVKNSWGGTWGEEGYFRILRGSDECAIESVAVQSLPIF